MKLKQKLLYSFLGLGLVPALLVSLISLYLASNALEEQAYNQLTSIRAIKQNQITTYFAERQSDLQVLAKSVERMANAQSHSDLSEFAEQNHDYFQYFIQSYDYYDFFLIDQQGEVFYTVTKEADYQTNLRNGPYAFSGLGNLYRHVLATNRYHVADFAPYAPSNDEPAAFIAMPVMVEGKTLVVALQLSIDKINRIMQQRDGMGETGETYLVGPDMLMRSDSYLDPIGHSVIASFAGSVKENGVQTEAVKAALAGETAAKIIIDYNGNPVLSAYTPLDIDGIRWVLLAEIDEAEAFAPIIALEIAMGLVALLTLGVVALITYVVAKSILTPIGGEPDEMQDISKRIASGDLLVEFTTKRKSVGVYGAMKHMTQMLSDTISSIIRASGELSVAAAQTSATSEQANVSLQQQKDNIASVASAMQEMTHTIHDVAENANSVATLTTNAQTMALDANKSVDDTLTVISELQQEVTRAEQVIGQMEKQSQGIGSVLEVIQGIAEQTNLLALNAAIEAARAGEQGRGFAVVADEVRQLAQRTQQSTSHIEEMIGQLRKESASAVTVMQHSSECAERTVTSAHQTLSRISQSVEEISHISERAEQIATAAVQQTQAAEEISQSLESINNAAAQNAVGAEQTASASVQMSGLATELEQITRQFKVAR